jgi:hypothetical protein
MERRTVPQRPPLAKVALMTSGVVPFPPGEVWKLVRRFGGAGEWLGLATAEQCASQLLVRARPRTCVRREQGRRAPCGRTLPVGLLRPQQRGLVRAGVPAGLSGQRSRSGI